MKDKFLSLMGMARRAGKIVLGFDAVEEAVHKRKAISVYCAQDLSSRTQRNMRRVCEEEQIVLLLIPCTIDELTAAVGKPAGIVALTDKGFADRANDLLSQLEEENAI